MKSLNIDIDVNGLTRFEKTVLFFKLRFMELSSLFNPVVVQPTLKDGRRVGDPIKFRFNFKMIDGVVDD